MPTITGLSAYMTKKPSRNVDIKVDKLTERQAVQELAELAELKMAKTIQEEIIYRTEALKKELLKNQDNPDPALNALLQRLASEQGHLAEMIKELTKLIKERKEQHQNL